MKKSFSLRRSVSTQDSQQRCLESPEFVEYSAEEDLNHRQRLCKGTGPILEDPLWFFNCLLAKNQESIPAPARPSLGVYLQTLAGPPACWLYVGNAGMSKWEAIVKGLAGNGKVLGSMLSD